MSARRIPWGAVGFAATLVGMAAVGIAYHRSLVAAADDPAEVHGGATEVYRVGDLIVSWETGEPVLVGRHTARPEWRARLPGVPVSVRDGDPLVVVVRDPDSVLALDRDTGRRHWELESTCLHPVVAALGDTVVLECGRQLQLVTLGRVRWVRSLPAPASALALGEAAVVAIDGDHASVFDRESGVLVADHRNARLVQLGASHALVTDRQDGLHDRLVVETLDLSPRRWDLPADTVAIGGDNSGPIVASSTAITQGAHRVTLDHGGELVWSGEGAALTIPREHGAGACSATVSDLRLGRGIAVGLVACDPDRVLVAAGPWTIVVGERGRSTLTVIDRLTGTARSRGLTDPAGQALPVEGIAALDGTLWAATVLGVLATDLHAPGQALDQR